MLLLYVTLLALPTIRAAAVPADANSARYIVKFKPGATPAAVLPLYQKPGNHIFASPGFQGFAGPLSAAELNDLQHHPEVEFIERDSIVTTDAVITQPHPPWGLARLSSRTGNDTEYRYHESAGEGTCVYILGTGVDGSHPEFTSRVLSTVNFLGGIDADQNGQGTAVAGVVASITYGVAKRTKIIPVKVLNANGSGTTASVVAGMDFIASDAPSRLASGTCPLGLSAVIALGGGRSSAINAAARAMVNAGVFVAVAAGASNDDSTFYSPAGEPSVCTAGATDQTDMKAWFSNYGEGLDLFAPGVDVTTTVLDGGVQTWSGTSYSAAYVGGLGAYLLGLGGNGTTAGLCEYMQSIATSGVLTQVPSGTRNLLAYNGIDL